MPMKEMEPYELESYLGDSEVSKTQFCYLLDVGGELDGEEYGRLAADCIEAYANGITGVPGDGDLYDVEEEDEGWEDEDRPVYVHVKVAAALLHLHTVIANDGREFEKALVRFSSGTKVNNVDVGGYTCDVFVSDYAKEQIQSGSPDSPVTLFFKADEVFDIRTERRGDGAPRHGYITVKPWALAEAIKAESEAYRAARQAGQRARLGPGVLGPCQPSLSDEAAACRAASSAIRDGGWQPPSNHER